MIDIQSARINTAGAYVTFEGLYVFVIGTKLHNNQIPIIRLGGHCEESETGWQCAEREALEEAKLKIKPFLPQATYLFDWENLEKEPQNIEWRHENEQTHIPCLVVTDRRGAETTLSLMYLANADRLPTPSSEVKGLLLLQEAETHRICQERITLQQYLDSGGKAIMTDKFDTSLFLEPFAQLRLLSKLLNIRAFENQPISL